MLEVSDGANSRIIGVRPVRGAFQPGAVCHFVFITMPRWGDGGVPPES